MDAVYRVRTFTTSLASSESASRVYSDIVVAWSKFTTLAVNTVVLPSYNAEGRILFLLLQKILIRNNHFL